MKPKLKTFPNGALVTHEAHPINGMHTVLLRNPAGEVHDKTRCDDYRDACDYFRSFCAIAKTLPGASA